MQNSKSAKILIVEDELLIAENLKEIISVNGYTIVGAVMSAEEAVKLSKQSKPDLLISNYQLPGDTTGREIVLKVREEIRNIPVIFISAYDSQQISHADVEPCYFIRKPFDEKEVLAAIEKCLTLS